MALAQVKESIPASLVGQEKSTASIVLGRTSVKTNPVSGNKYASNAAKDITFRIASDKWADFSNLAMFFKFTCKANAMPDDLWYSLIDRIVVSVNGVTMEDISNCSDVARVMTYISCPKQYYQNELHASGGAYKYCPSFRAEANAAHNAPRGLQYVANDQADRTGSLYAENDFPGAGGKNPYVDNGDLAALDNQYYMVPLNFLGLARGYASETKLFPLRNMTEVQIRITLNPAHMAMVAYASAGDAALTAVNCNYKVEDPFLIHNEVQLDPGFYDQYEQMLATQGWEMYFDSLYSVTKQISGGLGKNDITLSISRSDIRALYCVFRPKHFLSEEGKIYPKSNYYGGSMFKSAHLSVGGTIVPGHRIESTAEAWHSLQQCMNKMNVVTSGSVIDMDEFSGISRKALRGRQYQSLSTGAGFTPHADVTNLTRNPCEFQPSCFVLGFPLQKVFDSDATVAIGVDTLGTAQHLVLSVDFTGGSNAVLVDDATAYADMANLRSYTGTWEMLVIADTSRILQVSQGVVSVSM